MRRQLHPCVYMLASGERGTLYIGVTSDLIRRIWQHRENEAEGFTRRHHVHRLVWHESHATMDSAMRRKKSLKAWKRGWKLQLIESTNPKWRDLYPDIL